MCRLLRKLDISFNKLELKNSDFYFIKQVKYLQLNNNEFTILPTSFHYMKNLNLIQLEWFKYLDFMEKKQSFSTEEHSERFWLFL